MLDPEEVIVGGLDWSYDLSPLEDPDSASGPAFEAAMAEQQREIEAILSGEAPTFANTVEALERSGALLDRVNRVFDSVSAAESTEGLEAIRKTYAPKLSMHDDAIFLDQALYTRIKAVFDGIGTEGGEERSNNTSRLQRAQKSDVLFRGAVHIGKHPVAFLNAQTAQDTCKTITQIGEFMERILLAFTILALPVEGDFVF